LNVHDLLNLNDRFVPFEDDMTSLDANTGEITREARKERNVRVKKYQYEELCHYFLNVSADTVKHTLSNTTQFARNVDISPNMFKKFRSPFPACNIKCRNEAVATDTIYSDIPAIGTDGIHMAQIFVGRESLVLDVV
jgi:hypothetical protein